MEAAVNWKARRDRVQLMRDALQCMEWMIGHPEQVGLYFQAGSADSDALVCTCEPIWESDTNATIHTDECALSMWDHIEATISQLEEAIE